MVADLVDATPYTDWDERGPQPGSDWAAVLDSPDGDLVNSVVHLRVWGGIDQFTGLGDVLASGSCFSAFSLGRSVIEAFAHVSWVWEPDLPIAERVRRGLLEYKFDLEQDRNCLKNLVRDVAGFPDISELNAALQEVEDRLCEIKGFLRRVQASLPSEPLTQRPHTGHRIMEVFEALSGMKGNHAIYRVLSGVAHQSPLVLGSMVDQEPSTGLVSMRVSEVLSPVVLALRYYDYAMSRYAACAGEDWDRGRVDGALRRLEALHAEHEQQASFVDIDTS